MGPVSQGLHGGSRPGFCDNGKGHVFSPEDANLVGQTLLAQGITMIDLLAVGKPAKVSFPDITEIYIYTVHSIGTDYDLLCTTMAMYV